MHCRLVVVACAAALIPMSGVLAQSTFIPDGMGGGTLYGPLGPQRIVPDGSLGPSGTSVVVPGSMGGGSSQRGR